MKTAIIVIAVCEVIHAIAAVISVIYSISLRARAVEEINNAGKLVEEQFTPESITKALLEELEGNDKPCEVLGDEWCRGHCGPEQKEPDIECWKKYFEETGGKK